MKKILFFLAAFAGLQMVAQEIKILDITTEPEDTGKVIYTVMITPGRTDTIELLTFECTYQQTFPFEDSTGRKVNKIHEPVSFTYKTRNIKLVNELDAYINFRVPLKLELLKPIYGEKTFNENFPVRISTIKITAKNGDNILWEHTVPGGGRFVWDEATKKLKLVASKSSQFSDRNY